MKNKDTTKKITLAILGNVFDHYDTALYALLAPFISPLFFPSHCTVDGLIIAYAVLCLGLIFRPLGALFFGCIADRFGKKKAFSFALYGSASASLVFAILPSYEKIGTMASIGIAVIRTLQGFFSGGATPTGAIFLLERSRKKTLLSSIYDASSIAGILFASLGVFFFSSFNMTDSCWRILFVIGGITGFIGSAIKKYPDDKNTAQQNNQTKKISEIFKLIKINLSGFLSILLISGFSSSIYYFSIIFMNGYLPFISNISNHSSMKINTIILLFDFCTLPIIGFLAEKFSKEKIMIFSALFITFLTIPIFFLLENATLFTSILIRITFVLLGVLFSAPLHHLSLELAPSDHRAKIIAPAYALGSQLIGLPSCSIGFWLYKKTNLAFAPGIYLTVFGIVTTAVLLRHYARKRYVFIY